MSRKALFLILIFVGFCLFFHGGKISGTGEKVRAKQFGPIPFNPKPASSAHVIRGDANGDGEINPGDVVYLIVYFFRDGPPPPTLEHGDANGDGVIDISDMIYLISYLFLDGPPPYK